MDGWTTTTMQYKNATLIVHRPILTDEERKKREEAVIHTLANLKFNKKESKQ